MSIVYRDLVPVTPAPYGILSPASHVVEDSSVHWNMGITTTTSDYADVYVASDLHPDIAPHQVVFKGEELFRNYIPFSIRSSFSLSTLEGTKEEVETMVRSHMEAASQKAIEDEFWNGEIAQAITAEDPNHPNKYLASTDAEVVTPAGGTGVKVKYGLALLEQALGDSGVGERGVIHATRGVSSALGIKGNKEGLIETPIGNFLIAGTGYSGSSPDGTIPDGDAAWMYATGPVVVRLGPIEVYEDWTNSADAQKNTIRYTGYRSAAVTWTNNSHFAVLVDLAADYA